MLIMCLFGQSLCQDICWIFITKYMLKCHHLLRYVLSCFVELRLYVHVGTSSDIPLVDVGERSLIVHKHGNWCIYDRLCQSLLHHV